MSDGLINFGATVKRFRILSHKTLRSVGGLTGIHFTYLSKLENGHDYPSKALAESLDEILRANGSIIAAFAETRCPKCGRRGLGR